MTSSPWFTHPAFTSIGGFPVRTRLGVAPNHVSFRAGVLRTHLATALIAHSAARQLGGRAAVFVRWDDTNRTRTGDTAVAGLLRELTDVADIPLDRLPDTFDSSGDRLGLRQSDQSNRYAAALATLTELRVTRKRDGAWWLDLGAADRAMAAMGEDPAALVEGSIVNVRRVPTVHAEPAVRLTRSDGSHLWHLATVVDDLALGVTLIVRASDKTNAVAVQERLRWLLSQGTRRVAYVFLPRLLETDTQKSRVKGLLQAGVRPAALRWFLSEPFVTENERPAIDFEDQVRRFRRTLPPTVDGSLDLQRLAALDRKVVGALSADQAVSDLRFALGATGEPDDALTVDGRVISWIAERYRRPLGVQIDLYQRLTAPTVEFEVPPAEASAAVKYLKGDVRDPAPSSAALRWAMLGTSRGPEPAELRTLMPSALITERLRHAQQALQS